MRPLEAAGSRGAPRIAVVGGGAAGLTAARDCAVAGAEVVLLEATDRPGGRIRAAALAGLTVDVGAEAFATRGGSVAALLDELGLADAVVTLEPLGAWLVRAEPGFPAVPLPPAGTLGIPAAPLSRASVRALGPRGALRAAAEPLLPRRIGRDAASLAELVSARLGPRALDRLVRPVTRGVYAKDPADLPLATAPRLSAAFARRGSLIAAAIEVRGGRGASGSAVAGLRGGMTVLVEALRSELRRRAVEVRLDAPVTRIVGADAADGPAGTWLLRGPWGEISADAVILAVPERAARAILGPLASDSQAQDPAAPEHVEVVALALDAPQLDAAPRGTGALVAAGAAPPRTPTSDDAEPGPGDPGIRAKALTHLTAKWRHWADATPPGRHLLRLSYGGPVPATSSRDDDEVRRIALGDARRILGVELPERALAGMARRSWRYGAPAAPPRVPAGIVLSGDWVHGTGLASVVPGARSAAAAAMEQARR